MTKSIQTPPRTAADDSGRGGRSARKPAESGRPAPGTGARSAGLQVADVMSSAPKTLGRNDRLRMADDLMNAERCRHLPVLDERKRLAGIVSQRDLFQSALLRALGYGSRARDQVLSSVVVKEVMTDQVRTIAPDAALTDAARLMYERKIGCLPVVEDGALVGILTEGDFVRLVADAGDGETG